jgi:hypothetical protein
MWRFYALATAIVVLAGSVLFAHRLVTRGWSMRPDRAASRHVNPGNANAGFVSTPPPFFTGQGDWVMSALPECFVQQSSIEGPSQALVFHVPGAALRVAPGTTLRAGDCTVMVRPDDVWIARGADRVRVPPVARLYRTRGTLTLVVARGGRTTVRVYAESSPGAESETPAAAPNRTGDSRT